MERSDQALAVQSDSCRAGKPKLRGRVLAAGAVALSVMAGCATRPAPPLPGVLAYPEFVAPVIPATLEGREGVERVDRGWRFLQNGDLVTADEEFGVALRRFPGLYPARVGAAYVAMARRDYAGAVTRFERALDVEPRYLPGLLGRGQSLLALMREGEALTAFEAALAVDGSLADVRQRVELLRFRNLQAIIVSAREAAAAGRSADARAAYLRAIEASPDSPFLYREVGNLEREAGDANSALEHFRQAVELDSSDGASLVQIGDLLEQREDFVGAAAAYRRAAGIEPGPALDRKIAAVEERISDARLPAEFRGIPASRGITRGELAALLGVRLERVLGSASGNQEVMTDTDGHWAASWISEVARTAVITPFENHTFQPGAIVRRAELAAAVSQLVTLLTRERAELRGWLTATPRIADMGAGHLSYPAVAVAVASGVMSLVEGNRFLANGVVTGQEAIDTVDRLRTLANPSR